ncbi:MAG: tyrosine-type recombinase/integrase [Gemmataceae bacterium]
MSKRTGIPAYRRKGRYAVVTLTDSVSGRRRDLLLGQFGTKESKAEYGRAIQQWEAASRRLDEPAPTDLTVNEVLVRFFTHAEQHYRQPDGTPTGEVANYVDAVRPLKQFFGSEPAADFGPLKLKSIQRHLAANGLARSTINYRAGKIKRVFKWAASEELISVTVSQALGTVQGLQRGRTSARETDPVKPVPLATVEATLPFMPPPVAALVRLQLLTAARPGELLVMRTCDLQTSGRVWVYHPHHHKTAHRGKAREIYIGPKAQTVLKPWLKTELSAFVFSPADAEAARSAERARQRKTPRWPAHMTRNVSKRPWRRRRPPAECYTTLSYHTAICRACDKAFPPPAPLAKLPGESRAKWVARLTLEQHQELASWRKAQRWHPHQLRHTAATLLRKEHGIELARIILGHSTAFTTEIYAELDRQQAVDVMAKIG